MCQISDSYRGEQLLVGNMVSAVSNRVTQKENLVVRRRVPVLVGPQPQIVDFEMRALKAVGFLIGLQAIAERGMFIEEHGVAQSRELLQEDFHNDQKQEQKYDHDRGNGHDRMAFKYRLLLPSHSF